MTLKLGGTDINRVYLGGTEILKAYLGGTLVYDKTGGGPGVPVNVTPPVATGTGYSGQTLTTTDGTWTNSPTGFSYQWQSDMVNILGATSSSIKLPLLLKAPNCAVS